jgi:hypothetical protein
VRIGRKKDTAAAEEQAAIEEQAHTPAGGGPYDLSEVTYNEDDDTKIDLGSLIITGRPGVELRLQVDEGSGAVAAALLVNEEGAVELRAFASPRNGSIWDDVRRSIRAEAARQGGTATEVDGPWGTELHLMVTGQDDKGQTISQASRIAGITGPRWLLRATFFGKPAVEPNPDDAVEQALRDVIVVRGSEAMAPGDFLPLALPASAQRLS